MKKNRHLFPILLICIVVVIPASSYAEVGTIEYEQGTYVGELKNGIPHGQGKFFAKDGGTHVGEHKDGLPNGPGTRTLANGGKYVGEFKNDFYHGPGTFTWSDGSVYKGDWEDGKSSGQGTYTRTDGEKYVGEWKDDELHGTGVYTWADGGRYEGEFQHYERHGQGIFLPGGERKGDKFVGEYRNDKREKGIYTWKDGSRFDGEFKEDQFWQGALYDALGKEVGIYELGVFREAASASLSVSVVIMIVLAIGLLLYLAIFRSEVGTKSIASVLSNFTTWKGRAGRSEYWYWQLFLYGILFMVGLVGLNIEVEGGLSIVLQSFAVIVVIGIIIPTYTVTIRRLHDLNLSGWWILIAVAGLLFILWIMFCREGTKGDNRFGSDPQYRT